MTDSRTASEQAERARDLWEEAVRIERTADPDHGEWYAIARDMVGTLWALQSMAGLLKGRVAKYDHDRIVRDDAGVDPAARLAECRALLVELEATLTSAEASANGFWSAIGHVGVEVQP